MNTSYRFQLNQKVRVKHDCLSSVKGQKGTVVRVEPGDEDTLCITVRLDNPIYIGTNEDWVMRPSELMEIQDD